MKNRILLGVCLLGVASFSAWADLNDGMALIPAGSFAMGDSLGDNGTYTDELPVHTVYVSGFYMDKYLVTLGLWNSVYPWAINHGYSFDNSGLGTSANYPAETINWYDCVKWCNARSEMAGLIPCYYTDAAQTTVYRNGEIDISNVCVNWSANGYRLPTEAEWEKAARGGLVGNRFPWGDTITHSNANYYGRPDLYTYDLGTYGSDPIYGFGTSPVGSYPPNGYGLYDMAGNVYEWCWDLVDETYYGKSEATNNPHGPTTALSRRIQRGSSYWGLNVGSAIYSRCAFRGGYSSWHVTPDGGFRCVRMPDIGPAPVPPTVVQTNRTPSSTELGAQTSGSFRVFTNGVFQTNVPLNPNLMTIVLTHGWNDSSDTWPSTMASQYRAPDARRVCVAGTFNEWKPDAAPMQPQADGLWSIELELPPGTYEYRFVVDGCGWCSDPNATDSVLNPFGDYNAVLRVAATT